MSPFLRQLFIQTRADRCQWHRMDAQRGITLVEVLVTVIIISIGLLGVAGLQVTSVRQTANSGMQTQAMMLAGDLIERIRANRSGIVSGTGLTIDMGAYGKAAGTAFPVTSVDGCIDGTGCTPVQMATTDLVNWVRSVRNSLPVVDNTLRDSFFICLDSDTTDDTPCDGLGSTVVVQIGWLDSTLQHVDGELEEATVHTYQMVFEP